MDIRLRAVGSGEYDAFVEAARAEYAVDIAANARARGLYESLGYTEIAVEMRKRL